MSPARFRAIIPQLLPIPVFEKAFQKAARTMEKDVKGAFEDATAHWEHKPAWRGYVRLRGQDIYISVTTQSEIFKFVDQGTKAHIIRAKRAKMLHWVDPASGEDRFAKEVNHPGTKAQNISQEIQATFEDGLMAEYFQDALDEAVLASGHAI